jgi:hypothetical protein
MSIRKLGFILAAVCAALMVVPVVAGAQTTSPGPQTPSTGIPTTSLASVPVSGIAKNHKKFAGHFTVDRFVARNGKTFAIGRLVGNVGHRHIDRSNVALPASVAKNPAAATSRTRAASCPILHLVLGPVNLNLLGLVVTLGGGTLANQPIVLDITAVPGPGNLLGNLLCGVSNLLNGTGVSSLSSNLTAGLLSLVNSLLGTPALNTL